MKEGLTASTPAPTWRRKASGIFQKLFCERTTPAPRWLLIILAIYIVIGFYTAAHHEGWFDEAQAWLMARELSPWELIAHHSRYEGCPPMWHLILMAPAKIGVPFEFISLFSLAIASIGIYLILFHSSLPLGFRVLIPFSFFYLYQYAVVARNYALIGPWIIFIFLSHRSRVEKPWLYALALGSFAFISIHTALIAGGLFLIEAKCRLPQWKALALNERRKLIAAAIIFASATCLIILCCYPPADGNFVTGSGSIAKVDSISIKMLGEALAGQGIASIVTLYIIANYLIRSKFGWHLIVPLGLLMGLFGYKYANLWHAGIIFYHVLLVLMLAIQTSGRWPVSVAISLLIIVGIQIRWSINTISFDLDYSYSGAPHAAATIKSLGVKGKTVDAFGFASHAILPYFEQGEIAFANAIPPWREFFPWSGAGIPRHAPRSIKTSADYIVVASYTNGQSVDIHTPEGYQSIGRYPGYTYWKDHIYECIDYSVFLKSSPPGVSTTDHEPPKTTQ